MTRLQGHASGTPAALETLRHDLPEQLIATVARMMAKNPSERFQTPAEVAEALAPFLRSGPRQQNSRPKSESTMSVGRYVAGAVILAIAAVLVVSNWKESVADKLAMMKAPVAVLSEASKFRHEEVDAITSELNAVRAQLREKQNAISNLMSAIEAGADFKALEDRIKTLEQDKTAVEERIQRLEMKRSDREKQSLSTEVVAEAYCDFPFVVERLRESGNLHGLRDLLRCYIAAIDVHQDANDPSSGHMEIMLFEEEIPGWEASAHQKTLAEQPLDGWNCERVSQLPERAPYRNNARRFSRVPNDATC